MKPASHSFEAFHTLLIERTTPPPEAASGNWFRYVIAQGDNRIEGSREGKLTEVRAEVERMVQQFNDRRAGRRTVPRAKPGPRPKSDS